MEQNYTYDDPELLNVLVMLISESNCSFSCTLRPNVKEFLEYASRGRAFTASSPIPELDDRLLQKQAAQDVLHTLAMLHLCQEHKVMPFIGLSFDYELSSYGEIKYVMPHLDTKFHEELYRFCRDPIHFTRGYKWYSIIFGEVKGKEKIGIVKRAIPQFLSQGYIVTSLTAQLNPYIRRGEYVDYCESDATLIAHDGKITIFGKIPDGYDFDLEKIKGMKRQILPEEPKLLDGLVKKLLES